MPAAQPFSEALVAIDGSKFKAVNNRDKNFTDRTLQARIEQLEASIARYLTELDRADRDPALVPEARVHHLKEKLQIVTTQIQRLNDIGAHLRDAPDGQLSLTDPDARSMATSGRGTGMVGYNVQIAVDTTHHLIVTDEVTNHGHDRQQLSPVAQHAAQATGQARLTVLADRGYFNGEHIRKCEQQGIAPLVPKPLTSNNHAAGLFDKRDFVYLPERNAYQCPAGEHAIDRMTSLERGLTQHRYWCSACPRCPLKARCTTGDYRRISRWEHESVLDAMQDRLDRMPNAMTRRRQTVEHVFGTLKAWMGATHVLMKTLPKVNTEVSVHVLAYNLKRTMRIFGVQPLMAALTG